MCSISISAKKKRVVLGNLAKWQQNYDNITLFPGKPMEVILGGKQ